MYLPNSRFYLFLISLCLILSLVAHILSS
jgi:hypothetical protein